MGVLLAGFGCAQAQWTLESSNTAADLRGIDSVGNGVAWASGTNGTVLRTEDGGFEWQTCSVPPGAERLDFRGIQAFDANTAMVLSSGKGDLSRLYKTTDGCHSWTLVLRNPDPDGFWDAIVLNRSGSDGALLGDPVNGLFALWETTDRGNTWKRSAAPGLESRKDEGAFAASNSALFLNHRFALGFVTGSTAQPRIFVSDGQAAATRFRASALPVQGGSAGAGAFSVEESDQCCWVVVGGDYTKPDNTAGTAAFTLDRGKTWQAAQSMPHGYRSSVAYESSARLWIAVGPNGTDISADGGRNWRPVRPNPALHEAADADRSWNAISLPFVAGPHGRIGKLDAGALK